MKRKFIRILKKKLKGINNEGVLSISLGFIIPTLLLAIINKDSFESITSKLMVFITEKFGWVYLFAMSFFVLFTFLLALSSFGKIKLGDDEDKPDYNFFTWFGMLFGAGMGVGLVFWGVTEPISHFVSPIQGINSGSNEALEFALKTSFMHWGVHPWASYSIIGLSLAYFQFRKHSPCLISSIFIPLFGEERINGLLGKIFDTLAVFATVAGVATSLGLATLEINSGLNQVLNLNKSLGVQISIIVLITVVFIWTSVSGINKGMKIISDINFILALAILAAYLFMGPTNEIVHNLMSGMNSYIGKFVQNSLYLDSIKNEKWIKNWTVFYWAWWISWAPFVGTFIARISKGRTIREFIFGAILAPSLISFLWFSVFGTLGINLSFAGSLGIEKLKIIAASPETAFFIVINQYKFGYISSLLGIVLLFSLFITSANSATFVLGMLTSKGDFNPSNRKKVLWGIIQALVALILIFTGGLKALQKAAIVTAFPFIFVMLLSCISLVKALKKEKIRDFNKN